MAITTFKLNNGLEMPAVGLGMSHPPSERGQTQMAGEGQFLMVSKANRDCDFCRNMAVQGR